MKKFLTFAATALFLAVAANAVPAKPGLMTVMLSDGTTMQVQQLGDEFHHSLATSDGLTIDEGADGFYYYRSASGVTTMRAHNPAERTAAEQAFLAQNQDRFTMAALQERTGSRRTQASRPNRIEGTQVPTMGSPRVPIILVQYTDKKMSNTKSNFERQYITGSKSVLQYFTDQSNGLYTPQFDIYGIYDLPNNRATYGGNDYGGNDKGVANMVGDAITKAGEDIDWSLYDNDGDGEADVCIVVYAGVGEAQSSVRNSVWPCQWQLSYGAEYGDGPGALTRNGVLIDKFAVFNEIAGASDYGTTMDGIGTFCHEFSHCLGLPDFYETTYSRGYFGMGEWSLMDGGCYNGGSVDGDTPIGYSAYEKSFMGWIQLIEPQDNTKYTLPVFNSKNIESDQAIKITALNENEYWILENRHQQGWDTYIPANGVLITHFTYIPTRWDNNTVNNEAIQLATVIPADNSLNSYSTNKDLYGNSNHAFTSTSTPAMKANMKANGTLATSAGGAGVVDKPVTDINLANDGTATLWYRKGNFVKNTPEFTDTTDVTSTGFTAHWTPIENVESFTLTLTDLNAPEPELQTVLSETFPTDKFNSEGVMDIGNQLDEYMDNPGWTGSSLFKQAGAIRLGSGTKLGNLISPALDLQGSTTMAVKVKAKPYGSDQNVNFEISCGGTTHKLTLNEEKEHTVVFENVSSGAQVTFASTANRKRVVLSSIEVYNGIPEDALMSKVPVETTSGRILTISGITDTCYTVTGLSENSLYRMRVQATYIDETQSKWSAPWEVQLHGEQQPEYALGDVNGDGNVDIDDVNILLNIILEFDTADNYDGRANVLGNPSVAIDDVNAVINILLAQ